MDPTFREHAPKTNICLPMLHKNINMTTLRISLPLGKKSTVYIMPGHRPIKGLPENSKNIWFFCVPSQ